MRDTRTTARVSQNARPGTNTRAEAALTAANPGLERRRLHDNPPHLQNITNSCIFNAQHTALSQCKGPPPRHGSPQRGVKMTRRQETTTGSATGTSTPKGRPGFQLQPKKCCNRPTTIGFSALHLVKTEPFFFLCFCQGTSSSHFYSLLRQPESIIRSKQQQLWSFSMQHASAGDGVATTLENTNAT